MSESRYRLSTGGRIGVVGAITGSMLLGGVLGPHTPGSNDVRPNQHEPLNDPPNLEARYLPHNPANITGDMYARATRKAINNYASSLLRSMERAEPTPQDRLSIIIGAVCRAGAQYNEEVKMASDIAANNMGIREEAIADTYQILLTRHLVPKLGNPDMTSYDTQSVLQHAARKYCPADIPSPLGG